VYASKTSEKQRRQSNTRDPNQTGGIVPFGLEVSSLRNRFDLEDET